MGSCWLRKEASLWQGLLFEDTMGLYGMSCLWIFGRQYRRGGRGLENMKWFFDVLKNSKKVGCKLFSVDLSLFWKLDVGSLANFVK